MKGCLRVLEQVGTCSLRQMKGWRNEYSPPELLYLKLTILSIEAKRGGFLFKASDKGESPIKESSFVNDFVFNRIHDTITRIQLSHIQIYKKMVQLAFRIKTVISSN